MAIKISTILRLAILLCLAKCGIAYNCDTEKIKCNSGVEEVSMCHVCQGEKQCADGSDEHPDICSIWRTTSTNQSPCNSHLHYEQGKLYCTSNGQCMPAREFCEVSSCASEQDPMFCEIVKNGRLALSKEETSLDLTKEMVKLLQKAVNTSATAPSSGLTCPMFYVPFGGQCLAFFSPAKIPWAEARQFCFSVRGDLLTVDSLVFYDKLVQYMKESQFTTDFWIGGRYDLDTNAWSWATDASLMPLGSPYWAAKHSSSCVPRPLPQAGPDCSSSSSTMGLLDSSCYHYTQAPTKREQGWCAAMTYEYYFYFTDEICQENRSPICVYSHPLQRGASE